MGRKPKYVLLFGMPVNPRLYGAGHADFAGKMIVRWWNGPAMRGWLTNGGIEDPGWDVCRRGRRPTRLIQKILNHEAGGPLERSARRVAGV